MLVTERLNYEYVLITNLVFESWSGVTTQWPFREWRARRASFFDIPRSTSGQRDFVMVTSWYFLRTHRTLSRNSLCKSSQRYSHTNTAQWYRLQGPYTCKLINSAVSSAINRRYFEVFRKVSMEKTAIWGINFNLHTNCMFNCLCRNSRRDLTCIFYLKFFSEENLKLISLFALNPPENIANPILFWSKILSTCRIAFNEISAALKILL